MIITILDSPTVLDWECMNLQQHLQNTFTVMLTHSSALQKNVWTYHAAFYLILLQSWLFILNKVNVSNNDLSVSLRAKHSEIRFLSSVTRDKRLLKTVSTEAPPTCGSNLLFTKGSQSENGQCTRGGRYLISDSGETPEYDK